MHVDMVGQQRRQQKNKEPLTSMTAAKSHDPAHCPPKSEWVEHAMTTEEFPAAATAVQNSPNAES